MVTILAVAGVGVVSGGSDARIVWKKTEGRLPEMSSEAPAVP